MTEEEPLMTNRVLMGTGFSQMFSDSLNNRYNNLLVSTVGATVEQMGFLQGGKSLFANLTQILFGRLADRYGKKRFVALGQFLNGAAILSLIFFSTPNPLILLVLLSSFASSISRPSWTSLLGDYTSETNRGRIISLVNSVSQMGSFAAMLIAFTISLNQVGETTRESYTPILLMASVASIITGVLVLFTSEKPPKSETAAFEFGRLFEDPPMKRYLLLNFVYGISMSFAWPLFPYVITDKLKMKVWQIATLSLGSSGVSTIIQRKIGGFMDRIGRRPIIIASRVMMAVAPVAYALSTQWWHVTIAEMFLGVGLAGWMSSESTYVIDLAPRELRATYLASSTTAFGLATFIGSNISGFVVETFFASSGFAGLNMGLYISSILRLFSGLGYLTIIESGIRKGVFDESSVS